jgi:hypothetical protein
MKNKKILAFLLVGFAAAGMVGSKYGWNLATQLPIATASADGDTAFNNLRSHLTTEGRFRIWFREETPQPRDSEGHRVGRPPPFVPERWLRHHSYLLSAKGNGQVVIDDLESEGHTRYAFSPTGAGMTADEPRSYHDFPPGTKDAFVGAWSAFRGGFEGMDATSTSPSAAGMYDPRAGLNLPWARVNMGDVSLFFGFNKANEWNYLVFKMGDQVTWVRIEEVDWSAEFDDNFLNPTASPPPDGSLQARNNQLLLR